MDSLRSFLDALRSPYTYNLRRNSYLWLGMFWGLLLPSFVYALDVGLLAPGREGFLEVIRTNPAHVIVLLPTLVLGILFGAAGTVRRSLEAENERLLDTLGDLAMTDSLTGLHNRRYLQATLKTMLETAGRTRHELFVILVDLDGFKSVNDLKGHLEGDRILCAAAEGLSSALRQCDILGRYGGDEFVLAGYGGRDAASRLLERAAAAVRSKAGLDFSFGIASCPADGSQMSDLFREADQALGQSKRKSHESRTHPRVASAVEGGGHER